MRIDEMKAQERKTYRVTLQDTYGADVREIKVEALNPDHAKIKARAQAEMFEFIASVREEESGKAKTDRENREMCQHIAETLESYVNGDVRRCPDCGEIINRDWENVGDAFRCPECGAVSNPDDWDQLGTYDFLEDALDIEFRVGGRDRDSFRSVQIMVACGGPNIYLDTASKDVELYWWGDRARYPLSYDAVEALDDWASEYWGCM